MIVDATDPGATALALAWVIRNRARSASAYRRTHGRPHPFFGDGTITRAAGSLAGFLKSSGLNEASAWSGFARPGPGRDPTAGATYLHHHREAPGWASGMTATALIGPFLFLRCPDDGAP
jgi:hypothetical protein